MKVQLKIQRHQDIVMVGANCNTFFFLVLQFNMWIGAGYYGICGELLANWRV